MMDGYVLSKLETIPVQLIPEIGVQIKFHEFFKKLTGRDLDYPAVSVINLKKRLKLTNSH
jgi:hypothetical protein